MKKYIILFLLCSAIVFGQKLKINYTYTYVTDSTKQEEKKSGIMQLQINENESYFFSKEKFAYDSLVQVRKQNGIKEPLQQRLTMPTYRVYKNRKEKKIDFINAINITGYLVKEAIKWDWKILPEHKKVLSYKVQKAEINFRGRKWIAWFANDLAISDGPYKFQDLPGLILEIDDTKHQHHFVATSIHKETEKFDYPASIKLNQLYSINYKQYRTKFKEYRENPTVDLIGNIVLPKNRTTI